ncbi:hypothetical protein DB313_05205 (plasmid) [Borrelia turcica IST7]|uniref:Uncharacterized protein n=1 Tax=Borrelia turcica IST7 TaxID=1104446 RepID=A0A386PQ48_9SPIR|nr:hypothetical protein [Borrelia turcica]AYE36897.1 hypothetical protein DB313_05205 [Borrelia turcica IST7]
MKNKITDEEYNLPRVQPTMIDYINISEDYMDIYDIQKECLKELLGDCEIEEGGDISVGEMGSVELDIFGETSEIENERGILRIIRNEDQTVNICFRGKVEE